MKKFLLGVVVGFVVAGMVGVVVVFAMAQLGSRKPAIPQSGVLVMKLSGGIAEAPAMEVPFPGLQGATPLKLYEIWRGMHMAAKDKRIKAVVLMPEQVAAGWGQLEEIRRAMKRVREAGKPVYAYLRVPGVREYYLATAADRIFLAKEDFLDLKGLRAETMYLGNTMSKLGVKVEVEHAGKYKDAGDMFTRSSMSEETREVLNSMLDELYANLVAAIADGRNRSPEEVKALVDEGPFLSAQALQQGLVDELTTVEDMFAKLEKATKTESLDKVPFSRYAESSPAAAGLKGDKRVALLVGEGPIVRSAPPGALGQEQMIAGDSFAKLIREIKESESVVGVILRVNSPGGDAFASDEILEELRKLSAKKPLVVSMSDVAASGGYYIAMTGDPVVAYPGTITGSIGVIYGKATLKELYNKLGVTKDILTRGKNADIDSDYKPLTPAARAKLRESIDNTYNTFLTRVSEGRKRDIAEIRPLAEGRVWLGVQAKRNQLVDELGGLDEALAVIRQKAKIPQGEFVRLSVYPRSKSLFELLLSKSDEVTLDLDAVALLERNYPELRLLRQGGILRLMPYRLSFH